jgi:hypothetical protein
MSFADGDLVAGARITQWNVVRLRFAGKTFILARNDDMLGRYDKLEKAIEAFERVTNGLA